MLLQPSPGIRALDYLKGRGLNEGTIKKWQIGFAPDEFHFLDAALAKKQVTTDLQIKAGVSVKNDNGQVYDRFRNRVTFPIYNYYGDVVGFSARALPGDDSAAKYINSPETPIYNKSKILFGLNFAKEAIRKKNEAVVVEGQMDTISAHQAGFENTVASSGTALTEQQLRMLGRLTHVLKFCFDADTAGSAATRRAGELALEQGFQVKVIVLRQVKDPDELIKQSPGLWQKAVSEAVWFVDFYLNKAAGDFPAESIEQKHYLSQEVMPLLSFIADPLEQDHYIRQLSERFGISERVVRDTVNQKKRAVAAGPGGMSAGSPVAPGSAPKALPSINPLEKQILGGILQFPEFLSLVQVQGLPLEAINPVLQPFFASALSGENLDSAVNEDPLAKEAVFMVESELDQFDNNEASFLRELEKNFYLLKLQFIKRQLVDLTRAVTQAESSSDSLRLDQLNRQFAELTTTRLELENKL